MIACGDHIFPGPEPLATWKLLVEHKAVCTRGPSDRALSQIDPAKLTATTAHERSRIEQLRQTQTDLGELIVTRLGRLKDIARLHLENGDELGIVHGSPADPTEPFTPEMDGDELYRLVGGDTARLIVCGGSHVAFERQLDDVRIVNVGSVGEAPGGGYAHATILDSQALGTSVTQFTVDLT